MLKFRNLFFVFALALTAFSPACQDDDETQSGVTDDITVADERVQAFMEEVEGTYAHYDVVAYASDMGDMGVFKNLIISYGFTELKVEDGKLIATDRFCSSEQKSNQPFTPTVPDALTQAIIPDSVEMEIREAEDGELFLWRPETPTLLGISYEDSYNTPLPKTIAEDDPRLVDADSDGKPGVTVYMEFFGNEEELYIARREIFAFEAYLQDNGNIEGLVHDSSEQLIIGATNPMLTSLEQEWLQHDDLTKSPLLLVPIDDSYDCVKLMAERDNLFPPNPEVWED